jgi:hypothetical protein
MPHFHKTPPQLCIFSAFSEHITPNPYVTKVTVIEKIPWERLTHLLAITMQVMYYNTHTHTHTHIYIYITQLLKYRDQDSITDERVWVIFSLPCFTRLQNSQTITYICVWFEDRLCGLVVRVSGYKSRGPGSVPGASRFSEKQRVWNGVPSASWGQLRSYLEKKQRLRSIKPRLTTVGIRCADHATPSIRKSWHYFANKRRLLGRYSSLADQNHGV